MGYTTEELGFAAILFTFAAVAGFARSCANGSYETARKSIGISLFSGMLGFSIAALAFKPDPAQSGLIPLGVATMVGLAGYNVYVAIVEVTLKRLGIHDHAENNSE